MRFPLFCSAVLFVLWNPSFSQVDCQVTVNMDNIQGSTKELLRDFALDIQSYVNSNKWTSEDLGGEKIKCTMTVFFLSETDNNSYSAQIFLGSQRPIYVGKNPSEKSTALLRIFDDKWEFTYIKNQPLYRNESRFDPLTSFLDFYMNLVVGYDFDSYSKMSGTPYFQKALTICNQAPTSAKGWERTTSTYGRFAFVEELLNPKFDAFREGIYLYHYKGLDLFATKPADGYKNIIAAIQKTGDIRRSLDPRAVSIKTFYDTKYQELAEIFRNYQDRSVYQLLASVDPAHQITYEEARKK